MSATINDHAPRGYSVEEAAKLAGIGRTYFYEEIAAGRLVARKAGRRTIITSFDLAAWLNGLPRANSAA